MFHFTPKDCGVGVTQEQESILYVHNAWEPHFRARGCVQTEARENQREAGVRDAQKLLHAWKGVLRRHQNALTPN